MVRVWLQHMHILCAFLHGIQQAVWYHIYMCALNAFVLMLVCKPERMRHTFQSMYLCLCFTQKSCILIRSQRPFRGSNPPGCDFPPLVLWGWRDRDCLGQLSLLRLGNNGTVSPLVFPLAVFSRLSIWHSLTFWWRFELEPPGRVAMVNLSPYGIWSHWVSVMGRVPGEVLLHIHLRNKQEHSKKQYGLNFTYEMPPCIWIFVKVTKYKCKIK